jgi:hypothetical protein
VEKLGFRGRAVNLKELKHQRLQNLQQIIDEEGAVSLNIELCRRLARVEVGNRYGLQRAGFLQNAAVHQAHRVTQGNHFSKGIDRKVVRNLMQNLVDRGTCEIKTLPLEKKPGHEVKLILRPGMDVSQ